MRILAIDIGGSKLKVLRSGETEPRRAASGRELTPGRMIEIVRELATGWNFDAVSIGYPGLVGDHGPRSEPGNLGWGWVGFDYASAFGAPVKVINDAAMQALGSYDGGRMLFLGLGTGLGSCLMAEKVIVPLELGRVRWGKRRTFGEVLGKRGMRRLSKAAWAEMVRITAASLMEAFSADYVVLGGGNARRVGNLPHGVRLGHNLTAFRGGFRLWGVDDVPALPPDGRPAELPAMQTEWRMI